MLLIASLNEQHSLLVQSQLYGWSKQLGIFTVSNVASDIMWINARRVCSDVFVSSSNQLLPWYDMLVLLEMKTLTEECFFT